MEYSLKNCLHSQVSVADKKKTDLVSTLVFLYIDFIVM